MMKQHFLFQTNTGATTSTRVPSFTGSESEREAEREAVSANTHDLIRTSGIIEQLRAGRAAQRSQHAQSRTFNPETHYTAIITVTRHTSSPWKYLNAKY